MRVRIGKAVIRLAAATAALACLACASPAVGLPDCLAGQGEVATIAETIEGDTVRLADGRIVRLAGVEAPRRPLTAPEDLPWPPTDAARAGLHDLAAGASVTLLQTDGATDRHGRLHASLVLADGRWVEGELAAGGLVRARWLPGESSCFQSLVAIERGAREAATGLWADPQYGVLNADDPSLRSRNGLYELVEGRILSVGRGTRMVFLDFGRNVRSDFTVMVTPQLAERMAGEGVVVDALVGRRVRVRGVVEESGGPAIRLNDPAELELID